MECVTVVGLMTEIESFGTEPGHQKISDYSFK